MLWQLADAEHFHAGCADEHAVLIHIGRPPQKVIGSSLERSVP
jgi:hypothetical protein